MKKILKLGAVAISAAALFTSCGSTDNTAKLAESYGKGDYDACIEIVEARDSDAVLNGLDSSMLSYLKKDYTASGRRFTETQSEMQSVSKDMTVAKTMEAALVGENSVTYAGATYERILAYSMKAVDSFKLGNVPSAVGVMNDYTGNYKEEIAALVAQQKEIAKSSEGITKDPKVDTAISLLKSKGLNIPASNAPKSSSVVYEASPFLAYLGTLAYAANGDTGHAKDFALVLQSTNSNVDVSEDLNIPAGKGRLDIIALTDTIGKRTEKSELVSVGNFFDVNVNFKLVYPVFEKQNHLVSVKNVTLSNGESKSFNLIEDFDEAVKVDVAAKASGAYNRSLFRNLTKGSAAVAGSAAALEKASNPLAKKAASKALEAGLAAVVDAEKADIRQASYFPHKASAAGFTVDPGIYTVTVEYSNGSKDVIGKVAVVAGKPTVVISEKMN